jgi:hypothetical protein
MTAMVRKRRLRVNDDDHQRLQWPREAQRRRTMEPEHCPNRAVTAMAPRNLSLAPSPARRWLTSFAGGGMMLGNTVVLR